MLYLLGRLGSLRVAIPARDVVEVLPAQPRRPTPGAARGHLGAIEHQGRAVPLLDLGLLLAGEPARRCLSTRVFVIETPHADGPRRHALVLEGAVETRDLPDAAFHPTGTQLATSSPVAAACFSEVCFAESDAIYRLDLERLVVETWPDASAPLPPTSRVERADGGGWCHAAA